MKRELSLDPAALRTPSSNRPASHGQLRIYQATISFLQEACLKGITVQVNPAVILELQRILEEYQSKEYDDAVTAIVGSAECRKTLMKISSEIGLAYDPDLRAALRSDDGWIAKLLTSTLQSEVEVLALEGESAQCFLDVAQDILEWQLITAPEDVRKAWRMIVKLSKLRSLFPFSFFITGITGRERYPSFSGGFGDIYRASYQSRPVAVKQLRYFESNSRIRRRVQYEFFRETLVWKDLVHPYILPFLGIDLDNFPDHLCLVSPWMENGTVLSYLENHGRSNVDKLLYEVAQGLLYLHSRNYVHGDLRGANILINPDQSACLADFGLSVISEVTLTGSSSRAGSIYWMAPELIDPDRLGGKFTRTPQSDVYAFGCVCVELYTGRPPFKDLSEPAALFQIVSGVRPERPHGMSDVLWECVNGYWVDDPAARPAIEAVVQNMIWPAREPA